VGLPLRPAFADPPTRAAGAAALGLDPDRPTLLVTGGSLGARRLNETVVALAPALAAAGVQVLHLTGGGKAGVPAGAAWDGYRALEYLDDILPAYAAADLAVTRAGAGTVSELAAVGVPAVLVPLPIGNGEQRLNGAELVAAGGAVMVEDAGFTPAWARRNVLGLLADPPRLAQMAAAAAATGVGDAAARLAEMALRAARPARGGAA
jgi:UDP-N-acetylglucosamine:LPS N-acetylglucosamine transferase